MKHFGDKTATIKYGNSHRGRILPFWKGWATAVLTVLSVFIFSGIKAQSSKTEIFLKNTSGISPLNITVAGDDCSSAQAVTPDGTCYSGTTVGATDGQAGLVGCQSGNPNSSHPDVWYTFVATGSSLSVKLTAGTLTGNLEFILFLSIGTCPGLNVGSLCG